MTETFEDIAKQTAAENETMYEDALCVHFHSTRKVNPYDSTDVEWISGRTLILHRRVMGDTACLEYLIAHASEIECISPCDLITEGY